MGLGRWALVLLVGVASPTDAAVVSRTPGGFLIKQQLDLAGDPERVYQMLLDIAAWWSPQHTYSGDAARLSLDGRAGGCFCETLPDGGSVEHMRVVFAAPGRLLRLDGGLGPLQGMGASGVMAFSLESPPDAESEAATRLTLTYAVNGFAPEGLDAMAEPVDGVLAEQLTRLAVLVETSR